MSSSEVSLTKLGFEVSSDFRVQACSKECNKLPNMEVDKRALFPPVRPGHCHTYILLSSCGEKKVSHRDFHLTLIREMVAWSGQEPQPSMPVGRPAPASNIGRLDTRHNKHWPGRNPKQQRCVCSARGVTRIVVFKCVKCNVVLCVDLSCFEDYHTKNDL